VQRLMTRAAGDYTRRREALLEAMAARGIAASGRSGMNVWVPVPDERGALRGLLDAGWAAAAGERFRLRSGPGIRISIGRLLPDEAPAVAAALAAPALGPARTRSA